MNTRLYTRISSMLKELINKAISKNAFLGILKEELGIRFPNREFKVVDTSDTRYSSQSPHIPILFIEPLNTDDGTKISYTIIVNIDKIGQTDVITPEIFIGSLAYQLDNIDELTKDFIDWSDVDFAFDFQEVVRKYLETHVKLLKYLREQYPQDFSFGLLNGILTTDKELEEVIDRITYDRFLDINEEFLKVAESKYHLPYVMIKMIKRVTEENIERFRQDD